MKKRKFTEVKDDFGGIHALFADKGFRGEYGIKHVSVGPVVKGARADEYLNREMTWLVQGTVEFNTTHRWCFKTEGSAKKVYAQLMALAQPQEKESTDD